MVEGTAPPRITLQPTDAEANAIADANEGAQRRAAVEHIDNALAELDGHRLRKPSRELSLAITRLEEAKLWLLADMGGLFIR